MRKHQLAIAGVVSALLAAAAIAGCGGGGGGYSAVTPPNPSPSPSIGPSPSPSPTPVLLGSMNIAMSGAFPNESPGPLVTAFTEFSCGCTSVAGTGTTDGSGNFNFVTLSTPEPLGGPSYQIVPGRNYIVISTNGGSSGGTNNAAQAWTIMFAGNTIGHNHYLAGANVSDSYTAAVALYVYWNSKFGASPTDPAFDHWNFNDLAAFYTHLKTGPRNLQETQLLTDIVAQQEAGKPMYPGVPGWNPNQVLGNPPMKADLTAVTSSGDVALPSPCPTAVGGGLNCPNPTPTP
jgi:hypothetical protein